MSVRKDVFQAKVLQRLYPAAPKKQEVVQDSPVHSSEPASAPRRGQVKPNQETGNVGASCALLVKKVYTVLPPPEDYRLPSGDETPAPVSAADGTAVVLSGSEEGDVTEDEGLRKRRRRRRKRKANDAGAGRTSTPPQEGAPGQAEEAEEKHGQTAEVLEGQKERLSKSKKRKLKKKRQKEKLRSLGLAPQSRALEFTYRQDEGAEEEEERENDEESSQKVEEVLDFLQTTWDIYLTDRSCPAGSPSLSPSTAESLFARLSEGTAPPTAVSSLCMLRALLGQRDAEQLNTALQEFRNTSTLTTDETVLVCSLFNYWITEVLPMPTEKKTLPISHT